MRSVEVIEALPLIEFGFQIGVAFIAEQLVKFLLVRAVGSLHFAIELWGAALDVSMADTAVFDMPVELGLELVAVIGSNFTNAEWELVNDVIDKVDRVCLSMFFIDFECSNTSGVINGGILEAASLLTLFSNESQERGRPSGYDDQGPVCYSVWCGLSEGAFRGGACSARCA